MKEARKKESEVFVCFSYTTDICYVQRTNIFSVLLFVYINSKEFFLFHHRLLCCRPLDYTVIIFYIFMVFCYNILSVISGSTSKALPSHTDTAACLAVPRPHGHSRWTETCFSSAGSVFQLAGGFIMLLNYMKYVNC